MTWLAYLADVAILGSYWWAARTGKLLLFHWANALGCVPLLAVEFASGAWPVVPITASFGLLGWYGIFTDWREE